MSVKNVPEFVPLKKTDYGKDGLGSPEALDKFFTQLNTQNDGLKAILNGGVGWQNLNGETWEITVKTPAATAVDAWHNLTITTYNVLTQPQYRIDATGRVFIRGAFSSNAGATGGTFATLPTGYRPAITSRYPIVVQTTAPAYPAGTLTINTDGTMVTEFVGGITIAKCGLDHVQFDAVGAPITPATVTAAMSCFPINVRCKDGAKPVAVFLTAAIDQDQSSALVIAPTAIAWTPNQVKSGFPNSFSINNIAGLNNSRTYTLRGVVLYG